MPKSATAALKPILNKVHAYWFGDLKSRTAMPADTRKWFQGGSKVDDHIRQTFGQYIGPAAKAKWDLGKLSRREQIGLVVLLDQFPRNIHRGSGEAFAADPAARRIVRQLIKGDHKRFHLAERMFLYLPLEHSEEIADQDLSVLLFAELAVEAPEALKPMFRATLDYATRHRDVIRKFGRYPHRNAAVGRKSTAKENAHLKAVPGGF
jgi:uncharacterized protein (DUF924 family)